MVAEGPGCGGEELGGANVARRRRPAHTRREPQRRRAVHDANIDLCGRSVVPGGSKELKLLTPRMFVACAGGRCEFDSIGVDFTGAPRPWPFHAHGCARRARERRNFVSIVLGVTGTPRL
jgi:hypothetical protein